ncbi:phenylacetate--CoA ligase family protein [Sphingoaurantiacus capsulatus]|uniref:Phenylacetate--CoA ligase family protein n=1 Tax=Sphingoaurantiacus capsulatus TaxID=1771310 RepID=A0ABV7XBE0_9SPHN
MSPPVADPFAASPLLKRFASMTRAELEAFQLAKIRKLVSRLHATSPYYRAKMESAALTPDAITSLDIFRGRLPTSNKADFLADQLAHPPFGGRLSIGRAEVALVNMTGGTSGQGQEIYGRSQRDTHLLGYLHALPWFMAGLRPGDIAINCVPAGGMTTGGWGPGEGLRILGATGFHVGGGMSTDAKIDLMLRLGDVNFIYASTNYLHTLTEALLKRGISPREAFPNMHGLFIAAEGYPLEWAAEIEARWGCRLQEGYGSTQLAGFGGSTGSAGVFGKDGARGVMRLFEWETFYEIVDPETMVPVAPGELGEMVVTNLSVEGSPVVRFRTGDAARWIPHGEIGDGCAWNGIECGTIGRFDDMIKIRGNNMWPTAVDSAVFAHADVGDYAGRVFTEDSKTECELRVAFADHASHLTPDQRSQLLTSIKKLVKERTNVGMRVTECARSELPEFAYKARRWKDERQQGYKF